MARPTTRPTRPTTWLTDDQQRAWRVLVAMTQLVSLGVDRQLQRDAGMPHAYYAVLVVLSEAPQRTLPLGELATRLGYSLSRLSHALTRMEAEGWVERRPCPTSKRTTFARLTRAGAAALRAAAPGHATYVRDVVLAGLGERQLAQLARIGEQVVASVTSRGDAADETDEADETYAAGSLGSITACDS